MAGNVTSVTGAPARMPVRQVPVVDAVSRSVPMPGGKSASPAGESLPVAPPPSPPVADVAEAVEQLNEIMSSKQRSLRFQVDQGSGRTIIVVIDKATEEVIRQIPSEELLAIAQQLTDLGTLIDARI